LRRKSIHLQLWQQPTTESVKEIAETATQVQIAIPETQQKENTSFAAVSTVRPITVFYNVYAHPDKGHGAQDIVKEQMRDLLPEHRVFVRSIGSQFPIENITRIQHDQKGSEVETLGLLWNYCLEDHHADDTVVYIHNKGSFTPTKENTILRRLITPAALSRECSHMPSSCNTCSFRFSPLPHPHSPGNMWAARCSYIKLLMDPRKFLSRTCHCCILIRGRPIRRK
jgi:hypothetical protein